MNFYPNDQSTSTQATWSYNKTNYSGTNAQAFNGATGDFQTRPFNIAASFWPARYRHGSKKDEEPTTGGNNLFVGVTQESKTRPDGMAIGSALFFEFFFAMVITLTVLRKAGNAANGLAYGMTFMLTRNVTGGWCNPAIAIGAAASFSARGFSVRGSVEDEKFDDQFKTRTPAPAPSAKAGIRLARRTSGGRLETDTSGFRSSSRSWAHSSETSRPLAWALRRSASSRREAPRSQLFKQAAHSELFSHNMGLVL